MTRHTTGGIYNKRLSFGRGRMKPPEGKMVCMCKGNKHRWGAAGMEGCRYNHPNVKRRLHASGLQREAGFEEGPRILLLEKSIPWLVTPRDRPSQNCKRNDLFCVFICLFLLAYRSCSRSNNMCMLRSGSFEFDFSLKFVTPLFVYLR